MSAAHRLIERLDGVRRTGDGQWRARCPAHGSRSLSLAVADRDGRALVHCFAGCSTEDVLGAVGVELRDLFDRPLADAAPAARSPWSPRDVLELVLAETAVVAVVASDVADRREVAAADWQRLAQSAARLARIAQAVRA